MYKPSEMLFELKKMVESGEYQDYIVLANSGDRCVRIISSVGDDFLNRDVLWVLMRVINDLLE